VYSFLLLFFFPITNSLTLSPQSFTSHHLLLCGSQQTTIISLYSINCLVCITETERVYCAVRTGCLNEIHSRQYFKGWSRSRPADRPTDRLLPLLCAADSTVTHIAPGNQRDPLSTRDWCIDVIAGVWWQLPVTMNIWIKTILLVERSGIKMLNCGPEDRQVLVRLQAEARDELLFSIA
jgi:hypothetical protein